MIRPSQNPLGLLFGATTSPYSSSDPHIGVDFLPDPDRAIYAPEDGKVTLVLNDPRMGDSIHIYAGANHHALCHTSQHFVQTGQQVKKGDRVGIMGDTGYAFGVHLHWALAVNNVLVDPLTKVTEGGNMYEEELVNRGDIDNAYSWWIGRKGNDNDYASWEGKKWKDFAYDALNNRPDVIWKQPPAPTNFEATNVSQDGKQLFKQK